jgi:hypothetical protein
VRRFPRHVASGKGGDSLSPLRQFADGDKQSTIGANIVGPHKAIGNVVQRVPLAPFKGEAERATRPGELGGAVADRVHREEGEAAGNGREEFGRVQGSLRDKEGRGFRACVDVLTLVNRHFQAQDSAQNHKNNGKLDP